MPDYIFLTEKAKFNKIVSEIQERYQKGQPILIGTIAVETSEKISKRLKKEWKSGKIISQPPIFQLFFYSQRHCESVAIC